MQRSWRCGNSLCYQVMKLLIIVGRYQGLKIGINSSLNHNYWGNRCGSLGDKFGEYIEDSVSVNTGNKQWFIFSWSDGNCSALPLSSFSRQHIYKIEWQPGQQGYLYWSVIFVFAEIFVVNFAIGILTINCCLVLKEIACTTKQEDWYPWLEDDDFSQLQHYFWSLGTDVFDTECCSFA